MLGKTNTCLLHLFLTSKILSSINTLKTKPYTLTQLHTNSTYQSLIKQQQTATKTHTSNNTYTPTIKPVSSKHIQTQLKHTTQIIYPPPIQQIQQESNNILYNPLLLTETKNLNLHLFSNGNPNGKQQINRLKIK